MPSQSQGNERRQPPQANGKPGRQTRWAKEEDKSAEQWGVPGNRKIPRLLLTDTLKQTIQKAA